MPELRSELYPADITPYETGHLEVSDLHKVYYEQSGNPNGKAMLFLHGGPGGGTSPSDRRYFDPSHYRIILMDQRGAGKSIPASELTDNTTWTLIADIEKLRLHLNIARWHVFGGSWGSTLALSYAITHPAPILSLTLRGIFTLRKSELKFFYQDGASHLFPDAFDDYQAPIPVEERGDMMKAYHRRLVEECEGEEGRKRCGKSWSEWEMKTSRLVVDEALVVKAREDTWADQFARIECHYFVNEGFFEHDGWILKNVHKIRHIPAVIIQGRYDVVCPATTAWELHKLWPEAEFIINATGGHSAKEDGTTKELVKATEKFKSL